MSDAPYSKGAVNRAGAHLAARHGEVLTGARPGLIDEENAEDVRARETVRWWRDEHVAPMLAVNAVVRRVTPDLDLLNGGSLQVVSFRPKRFETIVDKLRREPGKLADMADLGGVRAVVNTQAEVDEVAAELAEALEIRRTRDWARNPQATGYRALHLHVREMDRTIEVQLRTVGQDAWANLVEQESRLSGHNYKAGQGPREVLEFFAAAADIFGATELGEDHPDLAPRVGAAYRAARELLRTPRLRDPR